MSAKRVIMNLLSAHRDEVMSVRHLIDAAALLGVAESNVRVTLARLKSESLVDAPSRGRYCLGEAALPVQAMVTHWREADRRVVAWAGAWVGVYVGALTRSDRAQVRNRERALRLMGMRELELGLLLRPDNIRGGVEDMTKRLKTLGLDEQAPVFAIAWFDPESERRARALWDVSALKRGYLETIEQLMCTRAQLAQMKLGEAAKLSYLAGDEAIRKIIFDPFLPEPLVDVNARGELIDAMRGYDELGLALWQAVFRGEPLDRPVHEVVEARLLASV